MPRRQARRGILNCVACGRTLCTRGDHSVWTSTTSASTCSLQVHAVHGGRSTTTCRRYAGQQISAIYCHQRRSTVRIHSMSIPEFGMDTYTNMDNQEDSRGCYCINRSIILWFDRRCHIRCATISSIHRIPTGIYDIVLHPKYTDCVRLVVCTLSTRDGVICSDTGMQLISRECITWRCIQYILMVC